MTTRVKDVKAGPEMDVEIAGKVFGHRVQVWSIHLVNSRDELEGKEWMHGVASCAAIELNRFPTEVLIADADGDMPMPLALVDGQWLPVPRYSIDLLSAWTVFEKVADLGTYPTIGFVEGEGPRAYEVEFFNHGIGTWDGDFAETAPLAICRSALKAVGVDQE